MVKTVLAQIRFADMGQSSFLNAVGSDMYHRFGPHQCSLCENSIGSDSYCRSGPNQCQTQLMSFGYLWEK